MDIAAFQAYRADPDIGRYQGWSAMSDAIANCFLAGMSTAAPFQPGKWFWFGIAEPTRDVLIGDIGVKIAPTRTEAELCFSMAQPSQGKGLASEAVAGALDVIFQATAVARIVAFADARNLSVLRLLRRIGMQQIGTATAQFRGELCAEHIFAIWRAAPSGEAS